MEIQSLPTPSVDKVNFSATEADKENGDTQKNFNTYLEEKFTQHEHKLTDKTKEKPAPLNKQLKVALDNKSKDKSDDKIDDKNDPLIALILPTEQIEPLYAKLPYLSVTPVLDTPDPTDTITEDELPTLLTMDNSKENIDEIELLAKHPYKGDATDLLSDMKDSTQDTEITLSPLNKTINNHFAELKKEAELANLENKADDDSLSLSAQQKLITSVQETRSERPLQTNLTIDNLNVSPKRHNSDLFFSLNNLTSYQNLSNPTASATLNAPYQSNEWQEQFQQQILLFNKNQIKEAELRLHPAELGSIQIKMKMESQQAHFQFISMHESVSAVIKQALPDLKHALLQQGIDLTNADVLNSNSFSFSQQNAESQQNAKENKSTYRDHQIIDKPLNLHLPTQNSGHSSIKQGVSIFI